MEDLLDTFLSDFPRRPLSQSAAGLAPLGVYIGPGDLGLEVAVYTAADRPTAAILHQAWNARRGSRAAPLLTVVLHGDRASFCGPAGDDLPVYRDKDPAVVARLCAAALGQPDRHSALIFLSGSLPSIDTDAPGLRNEGLFASHELIANAPHRPDWLAQAQQADAILSKRVEGQDLLKQLGYTVERIDNLTSLLKGHDRRLALAVLLDRSEVPESRTQKFGNLSPVSYALMKADSEGLDWVVMAQGDRLRLYPTKPGIGVGQRGRTETYVEVQTTLLANGQRAFLPLLFSAQALQPRGAVAELLENSKRFADDLATRLRDRIYSDVMPLLARGVVEARQLEKPTAADLDLTYRMALTILFRLLFVAYAEDKDLLPYKHSEAYRVRSLKHTANELAEHARAARPIASGARHWEEVGRLWRAVSVGDDELSVPAYNGNLFTSDPKLSEAGAELAKIALPNETFERALRALLLSDINGVLQPVDFRSLGVREFGTIYEGLLESEFSVADQDLIVDAKGSYVPLKGKQDPAVRMGEIYLHNRSGARKATGSYFTKAFAVEHLLDRALVPALKDHLERVGRLSDADAADAFFDFRVADIAMGSGHFLVAAIDYIEKAFADYLGKEHAPGATGIKQQIDALKVAAREHLHDLADETSIEDGQVLRRLIARRCVYGVDLNPLAVELARLAIWIHTFVPGLPLSVLDHNLVNGNALVGIGTVDEIRGAFEASSTQLFPVDADNLLGRAAQPLRRLANISDASLIDVAKAHGAIAEAKVAVEDTRALCDIITAQRLDPSIRYQYENWEKDREQIQKHRVRFQAQKAIDGLEAFHFPVAFPEVFLRKGGGFDVLLGNPPWEKARVEEHAFWARHFPGLRGLSKAARSERTALLRSERPDLLREWTIERMQSEKVRDALRHFAGMATGHPDLFRAFLERFTNLLSRDGHLGIVLPGDAFKIKGATDLRTRLLSQFAMQVSLLTNKAKWVFDDVDERKLIALVVAGPHIGTADHLAVTPECHRLTDWAIVRNEIVQLNDDWLCSFSTSRVVPTLPDQYSRQILTQMMKSPALRDHPMRVRRVYADFETTRDKANYHDFYSAGDWPVYGGESFDVWEPDRGPEHHYSWTTVEILRRAQERRLRSPRSSPYGNTPAMWRENRETHPILCPRIAFRDVSNRTNQRTLVAALVPPNVVTVQTAPWVLFLDGDFDRRHEAFLIGVMSSRICDWWMRRFVEGHVDEEAFSSLRVPAAKVDDLLWQRAVALAGRLAAPDDRFADWAARVGVDHGPLPPQQKQAMIDELDAVVAHLYDLSEDQLRHIFETFHEGWDWQPRFAAVREYFIKWIARGEQ